MIPTQRDRVSRITTVKFELSRRRGAQTTDQTRLEFYSFATYLGARGSEQLNGNFVAMKLDTNILENPVSLFFKQGQSGIVEQLIWRNCTTLYNRFRAI
ncbi:MAG: hypothetical protein ACJA0Z_001776 [Halioglobus sp.]|jgi:hypothetical protein